MIDIKILTTPIDLTTSISWAMSPGSGGMNVFIGTVREETKGRKVLRLEFECYEPMALKELQKIANRVVDHYKAERVLIHHRTGLLEVNDIAVLIAVSCPHRDAAFTACRFIIDTLKETVPIWKKEVFEDGEVWVSAHP